MIWPRIVSARIKSNIGCDLAGKGYGCRDLSRSGASCDANGTPSSGANDMQLARQVLFLGWPFQEKYVCTVFKIGDESALGDFNGAAIIGVSNSGGHSRPICVLRPSDFGTFERRHVIEAALTPGANEWHLHFTQDAGKLAADLIAC
jgi:hypothetical protein